MKWQRSGKATSNGQPMDLVEEVKEKAVDATKVTEEKELEEEAEVKPAWADVSDDEPLLAKRGCEVRSENMGDKPL